MEARLRASRSTSSHRHNPSRASSSSNSRPSTRSAPLTSYTIARDAGIRVNRQPIGRSRSPSPPPPRSPIDWESLPPPPGRQGGPPIIPFNCCDRGDVCECPRNFCACICNCVVCYCFCREDADDGSMIDYSDDGDESDHEDHPDNWSDAETHPDYWSEADSDSPQDDMDTDEGRGRSPPYAGPSGWAARHAPGSPDTTHKLIVTADTPMSPSFIGNHAYPPNGTILGIFRIGSQMVCNTYKERFYLCFGYHYLPIPGPAAVQDAYSHARYIFFGQPSRDYPLRQRVPGVFCGWLPERWTPADLVAQWMIAREVLPPRVRHIQDMPEIDDKQAWRLHYALIEETTASAERLRRHRDQQAGVDGLLANLPMTDRRREKQKACCSRSVDGSNRQSMRKQARRLIKEMKEAAGK